MIQIITKIIAKMIGRRIARNMLEQAKQHVGQAATASTSEVEQNQAPTKGIRRWLGFFVASFFATAIFGLSLDGYAKGTNHLGAAFLCAGFLGFGLHLAREERIPRKKQKPNKIIRRFATINAVFFFLHLVSVGMEGGPQTAAQVCARLATSIGMLILSARLLLTKRAPSTSDPKTQKPNKEDSAQQHRYKKN